MFLNQKAPFFQFHISLLIGRTQSGLNIPIGCHIILETRKPWVRARVQLTVIGPWTETYPDTVFKYNSVQRK